MAAEREEQKKDAGERKAKAPVPAEPKNMQKPEENLVLSGDKKAVVNPELRALSVSLPTDETDENGNVVFDEFVSGKAYDVNADALEQKNTEGLNYLVEAE